MFFLVIFNYVVLTQEVQPPRPEATTNAEALIDSPVELERFFLMQSNSVRRSMFSTGWMPMMSLHQSRYKVVPPKLKVDF